ncbi:hypothetical protein AZE42_08147 [Rhizopogon vesiculosus]|uniref:Uncharacterized protein n=1 Tax=Rhizopogon vesiculosus TaxID=180088 RepID=A0A1J8PTQ1_9AGAM|nr:hypothetical protein AZE42_08147 [Rhizopogon vesiculosus]
MTHPGTRKL